MERISKPKQGTIREFCGAFRPFLVLAGWRFLALPFLFLVAGVFDGIGIALFFPLLEQLQSNAVPLGRGPLAAFAGVLSRLHLLSLHGLLFVLVAVFLLKFFVILGQSIATAVIARDLHRLLADRLLTGISRADYAKLYLRTSTGYVANALTRELQVFIAAFTHYAGMLAGCALVLVYLTLSFLIDARMTVVGIIAGFVLFTCMRSLTWVSRREGIALTQAAGEYQDGIVEFMQQYKYLKATNRFDAASAHLRHAFTRMTQSRLRLNAVAGLITALPEPIAVTLVSVLLYISVALWNQSFALVIVLLLLFYRTVMRLMALQSDWNGFFAASGALAVIRTALADADREREVRGAQPVGVLRDGIALTDVRFAYGDRIVFNGVTVRIPRRASVALVGASGAGKSTLVDLITGVLKPAGGTVTFDGVPYANIDLHTLRERIGYVAQEIAMFHGSVLTNVAGWDAVVTDDIRARVRAVCAQAQCHAFITGLPQQYESDVGDRGIALSVGQRQRIAIARELYRNPEILIFDEATSALDTESERGIQQSIEALRGEKTIILIAHRLSTIRYADYIYILDDGRVYEEGTFDALYGNPSSSFRRMCDLQNLGA